jgi:hypothetical protein
VFQDEYYQVNSFAALPRAIAIAEGAGAIEMAHLLRALRGGKIAFFPVLPDTSATTFKAFTRVTAHKPAIALIDDDGMNRGPAEWPIGERAVRWARSIMIHSAHPIQPNRSRMQ